MAEAPSKKKAVDEVSGVRQSLIAKVGHDNGRGTVGCPCLTILKPAFLKQGDCFIWREADTHAYELAGKWDVVKGLRDGVEKAWLEKDEGYVPGSVAAEVQKYEDLNEGARKRRDKKRKAQQGSNLGQ